MNTYEVVGEYGPLSGQSIVRTIKASNAADAKNDFCAQIAAEFPETWKQMGYHNVYISDETSDPTKFLSLEAMLATGVWVPLIVLETEDSLTENELNEVMADIVKGIENNKGNTSISNNSNIVVFDASKFLAIRIVIVEK